MDEKERASIIREERLRCMIAVKQNQAVAQTPVIFQRIWEGGVFRHANNITLGSLGKLTNEELKLFE